jgi:hypothetical protein
VKSHAGVSVRDVNYDGCQFKQFLEWKQYYPDTYHFLQVTKVTTPLTCVDGLAKPDKNLAWQFNSLS